LVPYFILFYFIFFLRKELVPYSLNYLYILLDYILLYYYISCIVPHVPHGLCCVYIFHVLAYIYRPLMYSICVIQNLCSDTMLREMIYIESHKYCIWEAYIYRLVHERYIHNIAHVGQYTIYNNIIIYNLTFSQHILFHISIPISVSWLKIIKHPCSLIALL
jgi:hypothetical protein